MISAVTPEKRMGLIEVTPIVWVAMEKYVQARVELEKRGGARKPELEEARSYAVK